MAKSICCDCPKKVVWSKRRCKNCYDKYLKRGNPEYRKRQIQNAKRWHIENWSRVLSHKKKWSKNHPEARWQRSIKQKYGINREQYIAIFNSQNGKCYICRREPKKRRLNVDHCHKTNVIRGLLCFRCNYGLSWFSDDIAFLKRAIEHLQRKVCV